MTLSLSLSLSLSLLSLLSLYPLLSLPLLSLSPPSLSLSTPSLSLSLPPSHSLPLLTLYLCVLFSSRGVGDVQQCDQSS